LLQSNDEESLDETIRNALESETLVFIFIHFIFAQQSQTVTIHTELDSKATKHRQLPMS